MMTLALVLTGATIIVIGITVVIMNKNKNWHGGFEHEWAGIRL